MRLGRYFVGCGVASLCLAITPLARAQTVAAPSLPYNAGNAQQEADALRRSLPQRPTARPALPQLAEPQFTLADKELLLVKHFDVQGPANLIGEEKLREVLGPYEGRKLTLAQIYEAADKVTALYREAGYLVAKTYVPAQDARSGTLHLKLVAGQYGQITLQNSSLVRDDLLRSIIDNNLHGGDLIHKDPLERTLMLITDLPGAGVPRSAVGAGQQQETSDFAFTVPEAKFVDGYLLGDNMGSPYTGRDRLSGGLNVNSPLGYGDRLTGFGIVSERTHLVNGRVGYSFPLGYDGLRGEIAAFRTTYILGGIYASYEGTGTADGVTATLSYPMRRQRDDSIYISGSFTHKVLNDKLLGDSVNNRTIDLGTAAISRETIGSIIGLPLTTSTSLALTAGYVNYPDADQKASNIAGVNTYGDYARINLNAVATLVLNEQMSFTTSFRAQKSLRGNLDTSEQLLLTGSTGIRSYDEGYNGDSGYVVTPELKYILPDIPSLANYHHTAGLFTDVGAAWLENGAWTSLQTSFTQLNDVGLSYYGNYEYMPQRNVIVRAYLAHTYGTHGTAETYDRHTKGLVQIGLTF